MNHEKLEISGEKNVIDHFHAHGRVYYLELRKKLYLQYMTSPLCPIFGFFGFHICVKFLRHKTKHFHTRKNMKNYFQFFARIFSGSRNFDASYIWKMTAMEFRTRWHIQNVWSEMVFDRLLNRNFLDQHFCLMVTEE